MCPIAEDIAHLGKYSTLDKNKFTPSINRECNMEKIARGRSRETNIARGKAGCYIRLGTKPKCYLTSLLYWRFMQTNCEGSSRPLNGS